MENDLLHINRWLLPLSWFYGAFTAARNTLFDVGCLKSRSFSIPIINVGNITVGGTGKTPHVEYLTTLLGNQYKVAILSRGYKRKGHGFLLAEPDTPVSKLGDESWQIKQKFPQAYIAVDADRCRGIERLLQGEKTKDVQAIILDDAYQHRYVKPGLNILLVDYHRLITEDRLLPVGRLRENPKGMERANIVVVSKCPKDITPMGYRVIQQKLALKPFQELYFSTLKYGELHSPFTGEKKRLDTLRAENMHTLLLTGIGCPQQMEQDMRKYIQHVRPLSFPDHHNFNEKDAKTINKAFESLSGPKIIITTEKDATRLIGQKALSQQVTDNLFVLPVKVEIMREQTTAFNEKILNYVRENPRDSRLAER